MGLKISMLPDLPGIDFNLERAPSAQINVSVLEQDTNDQSPMHGSISSMVMMNMASLLSTGRLF